MTDQTANPQVAFKSIRKHPTIKKLMWLAALALVTLIPTTLVSGLIEDRQSHQDEAKSVVARGWGPAQTLLGPTIMIPVKSDPRTTNYVRVAPKQLDATVELVPQQRHRGFFTIAVYEATIHMKGTFTVPASMRTQDGPTVPLPDSGFLAVSLTSLTGVESSDQGSVVGSTNAWQLFETTGCSGPGNILVVPVDLSGSRDHMPFEAVLHLRGTESLQFGVVGKATTLALKSSWPTPSFTGDEPPAVTNVSRDGFDARWHIDQIGDAPVTTSSCAADRSVSSSSIGVDLIEAVPVYRMVTRAAKYGPLIVVLSFTAYIVFELLTGLAITIVQYGLMAASLSLFALLLVSVSEFTGYTTGYIISALLVIGQASVFTASVVGRLRPAMGFAALLSALFGFVYVLLGLENLALLIGSAALFITLSIVMVLTQHVQAADSATA